MKALAVSFSKKGAILSQGVSKLWKDTVLISTKNINDKQILVTKDVKTYIKDYFETGDLIVFICSAGIAVRLIAPFLKDKYEDPAVLVVDENGSYVISLLSGHIGGANQYAEELAKSSGGIPVITTASEQNGLLAPDLFAKKEGLTILDRKQAKYAAAYLNEHQRISVLNQTLQHYHFPEEYKPRSEENLEEEECIVISYKQTLTRQEVCYLVPKVLYLGIGCRRGISKEQIAETVFEILEKRGLFREAIAGIGTIDLKKEESGLIYFAQELGVPLKFYSADELLQINGEFHGSSFVQSVTGVDNVCERAATIISNNGKMIVSKECKNGVTVAVAVDKGVI